MEQKFVMITPKVAEAYLRHNKKNRPCRDKTVLFYASQMKKKQWKETGDPIRFSEKGNLIDGQHRLHAIIKSGVTLKMSVATGLPEDAFQVIDTGKGRNAKDLLAMEGISNPTLKATTARFILVFNSGRYWTQGKKSTTELQISNIDIRNFVKRNSELDEICVFSNEVYNKFRGISPSTLAGLYYIFSRKSQRQCDDFFEKYSTGLDIDSKSPVYLLRDRLVRELGQKRKLPLKDKLALFIIAWNAFLTKKPMEALTFKSGQAFPKPL